MITENVRKVGSKAVETKQELYHSSPSHITEVLESQIASTLHGARPCLKKWGKGEALG